MTTIQGVSATALAATLYRTSLHRFCAARVWVLFAAVAISVCDATADQYLYVDYGRDVCTWGETPEQFDDLGQPVCQKIGADYVPRRGWDECIGNKDQTKHPPPICRPEHGTLFYDRFYLYDRCGTLRARAKSAGWRVIECPGGFEHIKVVNGADICKLVGPSAVMGTPECAAGYQRFERSGPDECRKSFSQNATPTCRLGTISVDAKLGSNTDQCVLRALGSVIPSMCSTGDSVVVR